MSDEKVMKDLSEIVRDMTGRNAAITHRVIIEKALPDTQKNAESLYELADTIRKSALNNSWKAASCEVRSEAGKLALRAELEPSKIAFIPSHERAALQSVVAQTIVSEHNISWSANRVSISAFDDPAGDRSQAHLEGQLADFSSLIKSTNWIMTEGYLTAYDEGNAPMICITAVLPEDKV